MLFCLAKLAIFFGRSNSIFWYSKLLGEFFLVVPMQKKQSSPFIFVSSGFANSKSSGDYLRFKGLVEEELISLKFNVLGILRPSFLLGNRKEKRIGEKIGIIIFQILSPLMMGPLKRMKPIHVKLVANAMINIAQSDFKQTIFESNEIVKLNQN